MWVCLEGVLSWREDFHALAGMTVPMHESATYPTSTLQNCCPFHAAVHQPSLGCCLQEGIYEQFSQSLVDKVNKFKLGNGMDSGVTLGPLISPAAVDRVRFVPTCHPTCSFYCSEGRQIGFHQS